MSATKKEQWSGKWPLACPHPAARETHALRLKAAVMLGQTLGSHFFAPALLLSCRQVGWEWWRLALSSSPPIKRTY